MECSKQHLKNRILTNTTHSAAD